MANPFPSKFESSCKNCGGFVDEGDDVYSHMGMFICADCANEADAICECGNYKKPEFKTCFSCNDVSKKSAPEPDAWNPWEDAPKKGDKDDSLPF